MCNALGSPGIVGTKNSPSMRGGSSSRINEHAPTPIAGSKTPFGNFTTNRPKFYQKKEDEKRKKVLEDNEYEYTCHNIIKRCQLNREKEAKFENWANPDSHENEAARKVY